MSIDINELLGIHRRPDALPPAIRLIHGDPVFRSTLLESIAEQIRESDIVSANIEGDGECRASMEDIISMLSRMKPRTLDVLRDYMPTEDDSPFISDLLFDMEASELTLREVLRFRSNFNEYLEPALVEEVVFGLRNYDLFKGVADLSELCGIQLAAASSLCVVTDVMTAELPEDSGYLSGWSKEAGQYIVDDALASTVLAHPYDGEVIAEFILERGNWDGNLIRQYLSNKSPLRVGEL